MVHYPPHAAQHPLDSSQTEQMSKALQSTLGEETMKSSLEKSGITSVQVMQTRYVGPEKDGVLDVTQKLDLDQVVGDQSTDDSSSDSSGISGATIGIIVGCVAGGIALIALLITLLLSHNRRSQKKDKESLTNQWKLERELAEAERMKLEQAKRPSIHGSLRWTAAQDAGFTTISRDELERKRELRKMESQSASQRLSEASVMEPTPKSSKLESMRNALGLGKTTTPQSQRTKAPFESPSSAAEDADIESKRRWNVFKK